MNFRILYSNDGVLTDYSKELNNFHSGSASLSIVHNEDYIYIGSPFAFNGTYLKIGAVGVATPALSVAYWDSNNWRDAVECIDETNGLKTSGYFTFQIDRNYGSWFRDSTQNSSGTEKITGLGTVNIYDQFWIRLKLSASNTTVLDWIGHKFIDDNDLKIEFPAFGNPTLMTAIKAGKTNWEDQIVRASQLVIEDLIQSKMITVQGQIVDRFKLMSMTVSKTAELIYTMLGDDYLDQRREAGIEYKSRLKQNTLNFDLNNDGDLTIGEQLTRQGYLYR